MLRDFLTHTISSIIVLWLSDRFLAGVSFTGSTLILVFCGAVLGFLSVFIRPVFAAISLPLRILTLGLLNIILNVLILELVDIIFPELIIQGIIPLLITTLALGTVSYMINER